MRKPLLILLILSLFFTSQSQTIFTYGSYQVSKSEFLNAYNKNKDAATIHENSLKDYLQLYIAYKLKVRAAKDLRMDTLPAFKADIVNFKNQAEKNFLFDNNKMEALVQEVFQRSQKDIHVTAYFIDTTGAGKSAIQSAELLFKNSSKSNIDEIVGRLSSSGLKVAANDLGFVTVFTLPYAIENIIYQLKPGETSAPYYNGKGFYLFNNKMERQAVGTIKVAQILISTEIQDREGSKRIADSLYNLLLAGADFGTLAGKVSFDTKSAQDGGVLEEFGVGKYEPVFEKEAFSLKKDHEISKPFESAYGFHILKRISASPVSFSKDDEGVLYEIRNKVLNEKGRMAEERKLFLKSAYQKTGLGKRNINQENLWIITDSSLMENKKVASRNINNNTILFTFNDRSNVTAGEWIQFVRNSNRAIPGMLHESYVRLMPDFMDSVVIENYRERLSELDPAFNQQMSQFTDENLLFEIMNNKIWNKASADSLALKNYYEEHKSRYKSETGVPINNFEEARGLVVADYQEYLEEKWVSDLKKKYPVVINEKVFQSIMKE